MEKTYEGFCRDFRFGDAMVFPVTINREWVSIIIFLKDLANDFGSPAKKKIKIFS